MTDRAGQTARPRPDGRAKVTGRFPYASDLRAHRMLWGATVRSPHPSARVQTVDVSSALAIPGVAAVVTADDVPGVATHGILTPDQPVFARDVVRYQGEPVAAVAAETPEQARRAAAAVEVTWVPVSPVTDADTALTSPPLHPDGNLYRHLHIRHGNPAAAGDVVVEGTYEVGTQDQAFLGPEAGLAVPADDGGVELEVATQALHIDRRQIAPCLGLPPEKVRLRLAGVGGAFGGREDLTVHIHACLLALRTQRPVLMAYRRAESFLAHPHRHSARLWYRHHATSAGKLVKVEARIVLDGGAYASTSAAVLANACCFAAGPYRVPNAVVEGFAVRTNNPPAGAMRGFGSPQVCVGHESQMDRLAAELGMDPVVVRLRNALEPGDELITGQRLLGSAPVREVIEAAMAPPLPPRTPDHASPLALPGGAGLTGGPEHVRRGVGLAVGYKNMAYSEGYDDYSTAEVRLTLDARGHPEAAVRCAAAECGQGFVTVAGQIVREELGVERVRLPPADTTVGSAGSSSASRQSVVSGGAVRAAAQAVRTEVIARLVAARGLDPALAPAPTPSETTPDHMEGPLPGLRLRRGHVVGVEGGFVAPLAEILADGPIVRTRVYRHDPTAALDGCGQGDAHVAFMFAAHRAVVDVDPELGQVRVLEVRAAHDVGRVLHPVQAVGQVEGGVVQGLGLALMEELILDRGMVRNAGFVDYLLPTTLDAPLVRTRFVEQPEPRTPHGAKGLGEMPSVPSTAAILAAVRNATGTPLQRVPIRPEDLIGPP